MSELVGWTYSLAPLGDRALVVTLESKSESGLWQVAAALAESLRSARLHWIADVVPAYASVTVVYDMARLPIHETAGAIPYEAAAAEVHRILKRSRETEAAIPRVVDIPVCYGGLYGPDLAACAARAGMEEAAFAERHASAIYRVAMIGFMPGFPYLTGLPPELGQPRLASPRSVVPAGSVGIAGGQTGIYPLSTPGGWQLIGRTPFRLFDPERSEPFLLRAGDALRFVPIRAEDFTCES
ncbi:5-oxoprolinase subunit PxpB [Paenibacillus montanisoli]|uniref:5-oxoprolinase subunit PxpB n=1 Tax=Paenibacillus montanisoli TaxID=2081970 RepID=UPI001403530F|nr:5-oxoprolinase subunit PxpB [Paenibacillus montanisoli]